MSLIKKISSIFLILAAGIIFSCTNKTGVVLETIESSSKKEESVKLDNITIKEIEKYGNIILSIPGTDFLNAGFNYEDIITVSFLDKKIDMPVCEDYFDVENGNYICRVNIDKDSNVKKVTLAITMGDFATTNGIAIKELSNDAIGYKWNYVNEAAKTCSFSFELKQKGGYHEGYLLHHLTGSYNRDDFKNLTDEEFANFRMINTTGIGEGKIYRSSSPVNPELNRNTYAMEATEKHGIKTIINLADTEKELNSRNGYEGTYYSKQKVIALGLGLDFYSESFKQGIVKAMHFMAENDAPYLIHCTEGKNRAAYLSMIIECLMGANIDEITNDYMLSFYNYYGITSNTEQYDIIKNNDIIKQIKTTFNISDVSNANLSELCEKYLISIGVTEEDIQKLKSKLQ